MKDEESIDINLHPLNIGNDTKSKYYGTIKSKGIVDNKIIAQLIKEEGTEYQKETIIEILNRADRIKAERFSMGYSIHTEFLRLRLKVKGIFDQFDFDHERHSFQPYLLLDKWTNKILASNKVNVLGVSSSSSRITKFEDHFSGKLNTRLTPMNVGSLYGERIRVIGENHNVGLYFCNLEDDTELKVEQYIRNTLGQVTFMIPQLDKGTYVLKLVTQQGRRKVLKGVNSCTFHRELIVK